MERVYLDNIGQFAYVDDEDYERVASFTWYGYKTKRDHHWYARTTNGRGGGFQKQQAIFLHRLIMDAQPGELVTFKNKNRLDCRKANLVIASRSLIGGGMEYATPRKQYRGVGTHDSGRFYASIQHNRKLIFIGTFATAKRAALAYDMKARELRGELAKLNFPKVTDYDDVLAHRIESGGHCKSKTRAVTSQYLGVSLHSSGNWTAQIYHQGKRIYIGYFHSETEAAKAFDKKAIELRGEGARVNFPKGNNRPARID